MPAYLLHHRLHAIQRAQQLHGLFSQVIQHSGGRIRAKAGPSGGVQIGVAVDHQQAQLAQVIQDRA